jgi:hypothetical protein
MDRIAEEAQIHHDDFARRFGLLVKICAHSLHVVLYLMATRRIGESKIIRDRRIPIDGMGHTHKCLFCRRPHPPPGTRLPVQEAASSFCILHSAFSSNRGLTKIRTYG